MNKINVKRIKDKFDKDLEAFLRKTASDYSNFIKTELEKLKQKVNVTFEVKNKKIKFFVENIEEEAQNELLNEQLAKTFKDFENLPPELISQELEKDKKDYTDIVVRKAMKKLQEKVDSWVKTRIKKLI